MPFPDINPVILQLGPLAISWYSLSYVSSILIGWYMAVKLVCTKGNIDESSPRISIPRNNIDDYITWLIIGIVVGGRLGYVLFYDPIKYFSNPIEILKTYEGGMSFHGGILGYIITTYIFCKKYKITYLKLTDLCAILTPIGLFFGRIANFINAELYGKATNMPWGVIFPYSDGIPRHPSQLYESFLEGLVLFCIMLVAAYKMGAIRSSKIDTKHNSPKPTHSTLKPYKPGALSGLFLIFYAIFRIFVEFFREPDANIGYILDLFTIGQLLCLPMLIIGIYLIKRPS